MRVWEDEIIEQETSCSSELFIRVVFIDFLFPDFDAAESVSDAFSLNINYWND